MSAPTTTYAAGDFDDLEFGLLVADFDTEQADPRTFRRPSRAVEEQEAIKQSLGIYRHRTTEREV
jgi:hypothetical protein